MGHIFDEEQVFEIRLWIAHATGKGKRPESQPFHVTFAPASREFLRRMTLMDEKDAAENDIIGQELREHIRAWDLAHKDGTPMEVNEENLNRVLNRLDYFEPIYKGWIDVSKNASTKN